MNPPVLVLDCNYLCYRRFFAMGGLSYDGEPTGVVYGLLQDILTLQDQHATDRMVFCFDHGKGLRETKFPYYKATRRKKVLTEDEERALDGMRSQVEALRTRYLSELGFRNVLFQKGYEADDVIASVVRNLPQDEEAVIVSADKDLYQLLSSRVCVWKPGKGIDTAKPVTKESFRNEFGIRPSLWPMVKAVAGCPTDDVPGVKGVGEKTAARYLCDDLPKTSKIRESIQKFTETEQYLDNLELVRLPYPGTKEFEVEPDEVDPDAWRDLADRLGMPSIRNLPVRA